MSDVRTPPLKRLMLVEDVCHGGPVLERALAARGWVVMRSDSPRTLTPQGLRNFDAILLALDDADADVFELLLGLSALPDRPVVVLLTRRADARVLGLEVLSLLGVDHVAAWPARIEQIEAALEAARREHEPERLVS